MYTFYKVPRAYKSADYSRNLVNKDKLKDFQRKPSFKPSANTIDQLETPISPQAEILTGGATLAYTPRRRVYNALVTGGSL